jgi:hypothetical protein
MVSNSPNKKRRTGKMKKSAMIIALVAMALVIVSPCQAEEAGIIMTGAYTTMENGTPSTEFEPWQAVICHMEYEVFGNPDKYYKVVGVTNTLGDTVVVTDKVPPGVYNIVTIHLVEDFHDLGPYTVNYKLKLKKKGVLLDLAQAASEITVIE